jgi:hypothetical protein
MQVLNIHVNVQLQIWMGIVVNDNQCVKMN